MLPHRDKRSKEGKRLIFKLTGGAGILKHSGLPTEGTPFYLRISALPQALGSDGCTLVTHSGARPCSRSEVALLIV